MTDTNEKHETELALILTAFGPFGGVEENPSNILLRELPLFLAGSCWKSKVKERIQKMVVIETSAHGATDALERLSQEITQQASTKVFCLHLGVNVYGTGYQFEQCAYNDASFRIPDQRGYRPIQVPILPNMALGTPCHTNCSLTSLVEDLSNSFPAIESRISTDPGRFVCNYLYYASLNKLQNEMESVDACLFLHIPEFKTIPKEIQLEYLAELIRVLTRVELD